LGGAARGDALPFLGGIAEAHVVGVERPPWAPAQARRRRALVASGCAWLGVIHAWRFTTSDTVLRLGWGVGDSWALGYLLMAVVFGLASRVRR